LINPANFVALALDHDEALEQMAAKDAEPLGGSVSN
jgi:hypothetical protein